MTAATGSDRYTIGVFQDVAWARRGLDALVAARFVPASLSILATAPDAAGLIASALGAPADTLELHGLGAVVAAGPLVAALQRGDARLSREGLAASIGRAGFQPHDGYIFERLVERGGILVAVCSEPRAADALATLHAYGGGNAAIGAWTGRV